MDIVKKTFNLIKKGLLNKFHFFGLLSLKKCVRSIFKYGQLIIRQPKTFLALLASNYSITTDPEKMLSELKKVYPSYDWRNELTHLALFDIKDSFELKRKIGLTSSKTRWDDPLGPSTICAAR